MPDSSDPVTLGEVYRGLRDLDSRVTTGFHSTQLQIAETSKNYVHIDRYVAERAATGERIGNVEADIAEIRSDNKWLRRTIIATVGTLVINIVVGVVVLLIGIGVGQ